MKYNYFFYFCSESVLIQTMFGQMDHPQLKDWFYFYSKNKDWEYLLQAPCTFTQHASDKFRCMYFIKFILFAFLCQALCMNFISSSGIQNIQIKKRCGGVI
jgi:hypothetical protein